MKPIDIFTNSDAILNRDALIQGNKLDLEAVIVVKRYHALNLL